MCLLLGLRMVSFFFSFLFPFSFSPFFFPFLSSSFFYGLVSLHLSLSECVCVEWR